MRREGWVRREGWMGRVGNEGMGEVVGVSDAWGEEWVGKSIGERVGEDGWIGKKRWVRKEGWVPEGCVSEESRDVWLRRAGKGG